LITIEALGDFEVSRGVIEIITDRELENKKYSEIIVLVKTSFTEMRNELSKKVYGKYLKGLNQEQKENIESIVPMRIKFERYIAGPPEIPQPPSDSIDIVLKLNEENE
jgi:hypothetical protein